MTLKKKDICPVCCKPIVEGDLEDVCLVACYSIDQLQDGGNDKNNLVEPSNSSVCSKSLRE